MTDNAEFICVVCPVGCRIEARLRDGRLEGVEGQACKRGVDFVREELEAPKRMLTSTVRVRGGRYPLVPVRTSAPLPKAALLEVAALLRRVILDAPVAEHQVVIGDVLGTGVDIITSREMPPA